MNPEVKTVIPDFNDKRILNGNLSTDFRNEKCKLSHTIF